jgi:hypothetical protein
VMNTPWRGIEPTILRPKCGAADHYTLIPL